MKRGSLMVWSVLLAVAALAGVLGARAQDDYTAYLPLVSAAPPGPTIHYFRADVEIADPGDTVRLEWAGARRDMIGEDNRAFILWPMR